MSNVPNHSDICWSIKSELQKTNTGFLYNTKQSQMFMLLEKFFGFYETSLQLLGLPYEEALEYS